MQRRTFVQSLGAAPLALGQTAPDALDTWLQGLAREAWQRRAQKVASLRGKVDVEARQRFVRMWLEQAIGGLPERTPLNARITGTLHRDGYRVEKLIYESLPRFPVTSNVYVPAGAGPFPAVLGVAGHSDTGKAVDTYQHVWISLAKLGFVVLAFDPAGQGERSEYWNPETRKSDVGLGVREHIMSGLQCLLTGSTFARYEIIDGLRGVDYLLTRKDVDPKRIGAAGNSGGGTQAAYLGVLEPRLAALVSSCYITSWETMWTKPGPQDAEQVFPRFLADGLDFGDFPLAFTPRPFQISAAVRDFFPIEGARATYAEAKRTYEAVDAPGRVGFFEHDDEHGWSLPRRQATYRWMTKWLQHRDYEGSEPAHEVEQPTALHATRTGQVHDEDGWETTRTLNARRASGMYANRRAVSANASELRALIRRRLGIQPTTPAYEALREGSTIRFRAEGGVPVSGHVRGLLEGHVLLTVGTEPQTKNGLVLQPRGFDGQAAGSGYTPEYARAMRAILLGRTILGMAVEDVLGAVSWLKAQTSIREVSVAGEGTGGLVAQIAGALDERIAGISSKAAISSWLDVTAMRMHSGLVNAIVPGVLLDFDMADVQRLIRPRKLELA